MSVLRHDVLWVECRTCGATGPGPEFITRPWDGTTYGFRCGHDHHLDFTNGGARTWLAADQADAEESAKPPKETETSDA